MHYVLLLGLIIIVIYGPQLWVQYVLSHYNKKNEKNFPGNGGELARHILNKYGLEEVKVEVTDQGDHYDPDARTVRLTRDKLEGRTLTAITVAAHECGHAIQHAAGESMFIMRSRIARRAIWAQRVGSFLLFAAPVAVLLFKVPSLAIINLVGAFLIMGFAVAMHLFTLPVEIDASFNKALPILTEGDYISEKQHQAVKSILRAAAFTYAASALASLLQVWRWLPLLLRR